MDLADDSRSEILTSEHNYDEQPEPIEQSASPEQNNSDLEQASILFVGDIEERPEVCVDFEGRVYSDHELSDSNSSSSFSNHDVNSIFGDSDDMGQGLLSDSDDSDINIDNNFDDETYLYPGCEKPVDLAILELLEIHLNNSMTKTAFKDFLKFYVSSLPAGHNMPCTVHTVFKYVENLSIPVREVGHYFCYPAMHLQKSKDNHCIIDGCNSTDVKVFYELPIEQQIRFLFEHRGLADVIDKYREQRSTIRGKICDVADGSEYARVWRGVAARYKITLILNTDGVQPHKSSGAKLWPLMFTIMEVPPVLRSSFIIVWGIWFDKKLKPDMNMFLEPFVTSLSKIHDEGGVTWNHPDSGIQHQSPVQAPLIVADAPARAAVLNMQEHNAKYACNTCEQKSNKLPAPPVVEGEKKKRRLRRFIYQEDPAPLRTHDSIMSQGIFVLRHGVESKRGIKGLTITRKLPGCDLCTIVLSEYMHSVLKGIVLQFCTLWFFVKGDWYIGNHLTEINHFLCHDIHPPDYVTRLPRSVEFFSYFKANELRSLLLYYSLIIVSRFMSSKFVQHWLLLVQAVYLLLQDEISEEDLEAADAMLRIFLRGVGPLYGDEQYTYNVHQLTHLVLYVRRWGPLWATSAFPFESFNGLLGNMIHGSKNEGKELLKQIFLAQGVQMLRNVVHKRRYTSQFTGIAARGKPLSRCLSPAEALCLKDIDLRKFKLFGRVSIGRELFSSQEYDKQKKRNNSWVEFSHADRKHYGRILFFLQSEDQTLALVSVLRVAHANFFFHRASQTRVKHIIPVEPTEELKVCDVYDLQKKLIQVGDYLCVRPNAVERNL